MLMAATQTLEQRLDSFDPQERRDALSQLRQRAQQGEEVLPEPSTDTNLHAHTFYSYNAYGYSPSKFAWLARKAGLAVAGIVDFDVLDGAEEFFEAGRQLGLKTCASLESRVYVPEFASRVINSPGEPGVAYHMGVGFPRFLRHPFLSEMRNAAERRTRDMLERVNQYMDPVRLDFEKDVQPLTPNGNVTERHLCRAYQEKAMTTFPAYAQRKLFWMTRLGDAPQDRAKLQNAIRTKTMKQGGVGYVYPSSGSFPVMAEMNRFVLEAGAIPTVAWLDGVSEGEQDMEELLAVAEASGAAALNIIPDRNYTPGFKDQKLQNLYDVVALAEQRGMPVVAGTEMNAPGHKFVDSFETDELKPLIPVFLRGAYIVYAHSVLQRECEFGYLSAWARTMFASNAAKNDFFAAAGRALQPGNETLLRDFDEKTTPEQILTRLG